MSRNEVISLEYLLSDFKGDEGLDFWWGHSGFKPASLVKKLLSTPASQTSSERAFSMSGNLQSKRRSRLDPKSLSAEAMISLFVGKLTKEDLRPSKSLNLQKSQSMRIANLTRIKRKLPVDSVPGASDPRETTPRRPMFELITSYNFCNVNQNDTQTESAPKRVCRGTTDAITAKLTESFFNWIPCVKATFTNKDLTTSYSEMLRCAEVDDYILYGDSHTDDEVCFYFNFGDDHIHREGQGSVKTCIARLGFVLTKPLPREID